MSASPAKRLVLGALDPNACSPKARHDTKQVPHSPVKAHAAAPRQTDTISTAVAAAIAPAARPSFHTPERASDSRKRSSPPPTMTSPGGGNGDGDEPAPKRPCLDSSCQQTQLQPQPTEALVPPASPPSSTSPTRSTLTSQRSASPDSSSLLDNSQATVLTEPDAAAPAPPAPAPAAPRRLTREQTRQSAEILRLRLSLANYKVRTGQVDVPLERLEARPFFVFCSSPSSGPGGGGDDGVSVGFVPASCRRRRRPAEDAVAWCAERAAATGMLSLSQGRSPAEEEDDALDSGDDERRGGAASGLLSLARS
ncbi:747bedaf-2b39-4634-9fd0-67b5176bec78 [Thermothielavioides terrestris]|uniref:747bedaf-2b39-4634-9fd0-67b5176bec78 n=1 Tax=Thermothielavioides terrestris TaxID=2587410 RepID=A0A3S4F3A8_9PEZI|nr:747bedaf-2b39-4634-9fd0-67b5176bec78 [Thermothielavioides terrestris]